MQENIQAADFGDVLDRMARSIDAAIRSGGAPVAADLVSAKEFFRQLQAFLVNLIEARKRRTGADIPLATTLLENG